MNEPLVSIIITTKNEGKNIQNLLESIKKQSYKNIETIVVDNNSTDNTKQISLQFTPHVFNYGPERSAQRNYGAEKANGKYLMILDADMMLTENVVKQCVEAVIDNHEIKTITIPEVSIGENFWAKCKALERSFYALEEDSPAEAARFFPTEVFKEVGGYDLNITGPEDWDLPERINKIYPLKKKIKADIIHNEGKVNLWKLMKKKNYYGRKANVYMQKHEVKAVGAKTIYFLRPVFYTHWKRWLKDPILSLGTIFMLTCELVAGGSGYLMGKYFSKK